MTCKSTARRPGFTPVELIVLIALLLIALALFAPLMARLRGSAGQSQSLNNIKQLGLGTINLTDTYRGKLPAAAGPWDAASPDKVGTVHFYILPYIEQQALFNRAGSFNGSPWQDDVAGTVLRVFVDPRDTSAPPQFVYKGWLATTNYPCNWLLFKDGTNRYPASITDGTSNTLMFAQRYQMCNGNPTAWGYADIYYWTPMFGYYSTDKFQAAPSADDCDPARAQSIGGASILIGFCDGSARPLRHTISEATWHALCTPSGGEIFNDSEF
jgi:type II secretory pathway pseudopilin PulG